MNAPPQITESEFVAAAQQVTPLSGHIATRRAAGGIFGMFGMLPNPDPVLRKMGKSIEVYRNLLADPSVMAARARRTGAVQAMEHGFDEEKSKGTPARVLKACEQLVTNLDMDTTVEEGVDAAFFGYGVSEVMWKQGPVVQDLLGKPQEWFGFDADTNELLFKRMGNMAGEPVPARKFVVVGKRRKWINPYGEPDLAAVFWAVTFKRGGLKSWVRFVEKYGTPKAVGKVPRGTPQTEIDQLADKLYAMVEDAVAVINDDSSAELLSPDAGSDTQMHERLLMFMRSEIHIALLGNNQSTELSANKASATAAQRVEDHIRESDAKICAAAVNQVVGYYCEAMFPGVKPPVYAFWEQEQVDDVLASRDEKLQRAGARLSNAYYERAYKLQPGDLLPQQPDASQGRNGQAAGNVDQVDQVSFAEPDNRPADQVALDAAIAQLGGAQNSDAMRQLLQPALDAIDKASTPDEVYQALLDAFPKMDSAKLEELMASAYLVAESVGQDSASEGAE